MQIFAVGAGGDLREAELLNIVSGNSQRMFLARDVNYLFNFLADVLHGACEGNTTISYPGHLPFPLKFFCANEDPYNGGEMCAGTCWRRQFGSFHDHVNVRCEQDVCNRTFKNICKEENTPRPTKNIIKFSSYVCFV